MEFVCVAVAVLSLLSVGQAAPVSVCEGLTRPLEIPERDQLVGKWLFIAEGTDMPGTKVLTKMFMGTAWWNLTTPEENKLIGFLNQKMMGICFAYRTESILGNNTFTMVKPYPSTAVLLNTSCPDCLVFYSSSSFGNNTYRGLQLLSKRDTVTAAELEEFKKQVECLNLPPATILDQTKGFCPDPSKSQETATIDISSSVSPEDLSIMDSIFRSENGEKILMKMMSSAMSLLKPK